MYWIFDVITVDLRGSSSVGGDHGINIFIALVPVLIEPENPSKFPVIWYVYACV